MIKLDKKFINADNIWTGVIVAAVGWLVLMFWQALLAGVMTVLGLAGVGSLVNKGKEYLEKEDKEHEQKGTESGEDVGTGTSSDDNVGGEDGSN